LSELQGIWAVLGIAPTRDAQALRRAYLRKLKVTNPEDDAAAFQQLREAYEWAVQMAEYAEYAGESDEGAPTEPTADPTADPDVAPGVAVAPPARDEPRAVAQDPALADAQRSLAALQRQLEAPDALDVSAAATRLERILHEDNLRRFDILQLVDQELALMLAANIPRSDPLLPLAAQRLEWPERPQDASRPPAAATVLHRLEELQHLHHLESGQGEAGAAWQRLKQPGNPLMRWLRAYVQNHSSWPEIDLLNTLSESHPSLIEQLDPQHVAWWQRFANRPHLSALSIGGGVAVALFSGLFAYAAMAGEDPEATRWSYVWRALGILLAAGLVRLYLIEWPIVLLQRHWHGYLPTWVRMGWLADGMLLLALGLLARDVPWLAWTFAAFALLTACWGAVAGGPAQPAFHADHARAGLMNARVVRIVVYNALAGAWLVAMASTLPGGLGTPLFITVAAVLAASALGRERQQEWFSREFTVAQQRVACGVALAVVAVLGYALMVAGNEPEWQPTLFVAVIACIVLRRAAPLNLHLGEFLRGFAWLGLFVGITLLRLVAEAGSRALELHGEADQLLVGGGLFFLTGVAISALRWLWMLRV
jgi:hypothetical protein